MKFQFFCLPHETPPKQHEAAPLDLAIGVIVGVATAWRQGTTVTFTDPARLLDTVKPHIAVINSHIRDKLRRAACRLFSSPDSEE